MCQPLHKLLAGEGSGGDCVVNPLPDLWYCHLRLLVVTGENVHETRE